MAMNMLPRTILSFFRLSPFRTSIGFTVAILRAGTLPAITEQRMMMAAPHIISALLLNTSTSLLNSNETCFSNATAINAPIANEKVVSNNDSVIRRLIMLARDVPRSILVAISLILNLENANVRKI